MASSQPEGSADDMFRPPVNRAMRVLDRSFFLKKIPASAARVFDNQNISRIRAELIKSSDILELARYPPVRVDEVAGRKCVVLRPDIKHDNEMTWTPKIKELLDTKEIGLRPYEVVLDYDYWQSHEILSSVLPEEEQDELPSGFTIMGHIAHLNLRDDYLPYKHLIATVILDKNKPTVQTVINKVDDVGTQNEFRTFTPEILAGRQDLNVVVHESDCEFRFNCSEVYWNSRLHTEHTRMLGKFQKGEVVCDAMSGVGPFAIPAGKKKVFVWASDLNPKSYESLVDAIKRNRVSGFVRASNEDARTFIRKAARQLLESKPRHITILAKVSGGDPKPKQRSSHDDPATRGFHPPAKKALETLTQPRTFSHYVMNLPASATSFLDAFVGLYAGHEELFQPHTETKLPMIHCYCFLKKGEDERPDEVRICEEVSRVIRHEIKHDDPEVEIFRVRNVAPNKMMYCASFRLPPEVAFRR